MKPVLLLALACLICARADYVEVFGEGKPGSADAASLEQRDLDEQLLELQQPVVEDYAAVEPLGETLYIMDQKPSGSYRVTGMFQNMQVEERESQPINELLERPRISFFDLSWSNWVDERLQFVDLVQELLVSSGTRCPHIQPEAASFDTGMVSYLASSRFGPAILTTYAQKIQESDDFDFDYDDVHITESAMGKSYEDASLLEDLSANANEAFQQAESESSPLLKDNLGFFAANLKADQEKGMFQNQLDGEFESVQSSVKLPVTYFARWDSLEDSDEGYLLQQSGPQADGYIASDQLGNCVIFVLLLIGCLYVWISLARSCCTTFSEASQRKKEQRSAAYSLAQKELLVPLNPEKADPAPLIETAATQTPEGSYYVSSETGFQKVVVPLSK